MTFLYSIVKDYPNSDEAKIADKILSSYKKHQKTTTKQRN